MFMGLRISAAFYVMSSKAQRHANLPTKGDSVEKVLRYTAHATHFRRRICLRPFWRDRP
jgi:hypothetical protein